MKIYKNTRLFILVMMTGLLFTACGTSVPSALNEQALSQGQVSSMTSNDITGNNYKQFRLQGSFAPPSGMTRAEANKIIDQFERGTFTEATHQESKRLFFQQISNASTWQQAHSSARRYMETTRTRIIAFFEHQLLAQSMLRFVLLREQPTRELQQAVEYYFDILLQHNTFEATELSAQALLLLRGYWSSDKIAQTAQKIVEQNTVFYKTTDDIFKASAWLESKGSQKSEYISLSAEQGSYKARTQYRDYITSYPKNQMPALAKINPDTGNEIMAGEYTRGLAIIVLLAQESALQK